MASFANHESETLLRSNSDCLPRPMCVILSMILASKFDPVDYLFFSPLFRLWATEIEFEISPLVYTFSSMFQCFSFLLPDNTIPAFFGNSTDYFKLLDQDDNSILIGARNALYNISLDRLIEQPSQRVTWTSSDAHRELCTLKGKADQDCQNYIRVYARLGANKIMLCGTNAYKPLCRYYNLLPGNGSIAYDNNEMEALGRCPYNPLHNSTYVFTGK